MSTAAWFVAGLLAGAWYLQFAQRGHVGRERKAYTNGLLIAGMVYVLFALVWGDARWVGIEVLGVAACAVLVWLGRHHHFLWVGLGWLLHPLWDVALHLRGPGAHVVPAWYAVACVSFDVLLAVAIGLRLPHLRRTARSTATALS